MIEEGLDEMGFGVVDDSVLDEVHLGRKGGLVAVSPHRL